MAAIKDEAIVLRKLDYSESSQVLALFTRLHGKARVIAKGVKRSTKTRFAPALDLLDAGTAVLSLRHPRQEALAILTEWSQTRPAGALRERLDRLYAAQYAAAITAELTEDWDPHVGVFDALAATLAALSAATATLAIAVRYQRALLDQIGLAPAFDRCVACNRENFAKHGLHFSSCEGGLVCRDCEAAHTEKRGVPAAALPWLTGAVGDETGLAHAFAILDYHIAHLVGKPVTLGRTYLDIC